MRIVKLNAETKKDLLKNLLKRSPSNFGNYAETVQEIVDDVRDNGDAALFSYTKKFDKADITAENVKVTQKEIDYAYTQVSLSSLTLSEKPRRTFGSTMRSRSSIAGLTPSQMELFSDRRLQHLHL